MSEVTFAKTFLATLDKRPIKLAADHVSDPRQYPSQSPYTLPRQTHLFPKRAAPSAPKDNLTITLKPMRGGPETVVLEKQSPESTIHDIKTLYAERTGLAVEKVKFLLNKKPASDLKTLAELGVKDDTVEFSVMVMGGASTPVVSGTPAVQSPVIKAGEKMDVDEGPESERAQAEAEKMEGVEDSVRQTLGGDGFWEDLEGFLSQRLRDEKEGRRLVGVFREAWKRS